MKSTPPSSQLTRVKLEHYDPEAGECVKYGQSFFHYRPHRRLPKDRAALLRCEEMFMGRQRGEVHFVVLAWDGKDFVVLSHLHPGEAKPFMAKLKGVSATDAVAAAELAANRRKAENDARPKCGCGNQIILIEDQQRRDECISCMDNRLGTPKKTSGRPQLQKDRKKVRKAGKHDSH